VIGAVKDLSDLYNRINPRGPYRISLFANASEVGADWPAPFHQNGERIDTLIRGVGCLLANDLADAAWPVTADLWRSIQQLERELIDNWSRPDYYRFLTRDLERTGQKGDGIYRLFGEVLAVYLDIICTVRPDYHTQYGSRISALRRLVAQTGDISSSVTTPDF